MTFNYHSDERRSEDAVHRAAEEIASVSSIPPSPSLALAAHVTECALHFSFHSFAYLLRNKSAPKKHVTETEETVKTATAEESENPTDCVDNKMFTLRAECGSACFEKTSFT